MKELLAAYYQKLILDSSCKLCDHIGSSTEMDIWNLPRVLVLHLARSRLYHKIHTYVDFPITDLNLHEFVGPMVNKRSCSYRLRSVCNHYGHQTTSGHYTAFCRDGNSDKWLNFDDETVSIVNVNDIVTENAYILMYETC